MIQKVSFPSHDNDKNHSKFPSIIKFSLRHCPLISLTFESPTLSCTSKLKCYKIIFLNTTIKLFFSTLQFLPKNSTLQ